MRRIRSIVIAQTLEHNENTIIVPIHPDCYLKDNSDGGKQAIAIMMKEEYEDGETYTKEEVPDQKAEEGNVGG